jgi:hypothetical protein
LDEILNEADLHQKVLHTGTSQIQDGHVVTREWAADYDEGFLYWRDYEPDKGIVESQKQVAAALNEIAENSATSLERERTGYLAGFVNFTVPYTDAWTTAHHLNAILDWYAPWQLTTQPRISGSIRSLQAQSIPPCCTISSLSRVIPLVHEEHSILLSRAAA